MEEHHESPWLLEGVQSNFLVGLGEVQSNFQVGRGGTCCRCGSPRLLEEVQINFPVGLDEVQSNFPAVVEIYGC